MTRAFLKAANGVLADEHIEAAKAKLALNPSLGDLVQGTGGARKLRQYGIKGQSRVIYYFQAGEGEVFFLTCYPKARKADLTHDEKAKIKAIIALIKSGTRS